MPNERDREYFLSKRTDRTYFSKTFGTREKLRYHSKVIDGEAALAFARVEDEIVRRATNAGRIEIRATVLEDEREIKTLLIQKFSKVTGPHDYSYFTFQGREIETLLNFVASIKTAPLEGSGNLRRYIAGRHPRLW